MDFGGGLSSVAHLVRLPVDVAKLDRSVAAGLPGGARERAVLRAVAGITQSMNILLLAEDVETEAQAFVLRRHGCGIMQGFLYGRPVAAAEQLPPRIWPCAVKQPTWPRPAAAGRFELWASSATVNIE